MTKKRIKINKQDFALNYAFWTLEDLHENWCIDDEKYNDLLDSLLKYVETKISPPSESGDVIERYVIVEYEE